MEDANIPLPEIGLGDLALRIHQVRGVSDEINAVKRWKEEHLILISQSVDNEATGYLYRGVKKKNDQIKCLEKTKEKLLGKVINHLDTDSYDYLVESSGRRRCLPPVSEEEEEEEFAGLNRTPDADRRRIVAAGAVAAADLPRCRSPADPQRVNLIEAVIEKLKLDKEDLLFKMLESCENGETDEWYEEITVINDRIYSLDREAYKHYGMIDDAALIERK